MPISVGSVEVDVVPNTQGVYQRLRSGLVPAATRAGEDAGSAAGRSFGPAMQQQVAGVGLRIGEEIGNQIASRITAALRGAIRDGITQGGRTALPAATRQGDETGGAFSRALKVRLEAAFRSLPKINIDANTSEADADLQALRVRMETLANKRIGIDITAEDAKAEIRLIEAELTRLGSRHPNVQVRADTAAALAQLAAVRAEIDAVDGKTARIDIDTSGALSAVFQLSVAIVGLAALPVFPVLAAGVGLFTAAVVAAAVGVGALAAVAVPAFVGIAGALQAQKAAQDAATNSALKGGQAAGQGTAKALQLAGAQQSLATAERNGARQIAQAQQQVVQAKQAAADAVVQAALRNQQAARQVEDSERQLARAQKDARQAQLDLTAARKQAARELEDLANKYIDAQLAQRDAALQVAEAQQELKRTLVDPKATALQRQAAQLAYDQAVQRLKEQTLETGRLKDQQAEAAKKGVEGSDTVRQAQDKVAQSLQDVVLRTRDVKDAQAEAARTQQETARQIAEAQRRVSEATANVAVAQQNAADSVASAQRQIASASQQAAGGVDQAAIAQAKYQQALAKLSPAARATFDAFLRLRDAFKAWSTSLQPDVMPLFTRGLDGIRRSLPGLTPFVQAAAKAVGELQDRVSRGFKSPWWIQFKAELARSVYPALLGLGVFFGQTFKGIAGIVDAFLPHLGEFGTRLDRIGARFATWGTGLKGSPEFERFLAYASSRAPVVSEAMRAIARAFLDVAKALGPLADLALQVLISLSQGLSWLATNLPGLVQLMYGLFVATRAYVIAQVAVNTALIAYRGLMLIAILLTQGWTAAIIAASIAFETNPAVAVITAIIVALVALVLGIKYAWDHWDGFRTAVLAVWSAIQAAALYVWDSALKPTFDALVIALQTAGRWATWLWQNVLSPVFSAISLAARILIVAILTVLIAPLILAFQAVAAEATWLWQVSLGPIFRAIGGAAVWLYESAIKPVFNGIAASAGWLWTTGIKPAADAIVGAFQWLGRQASWLYTSAISPAVHAIGDVFAWLWRNSVQPIFGWISDKAGWLWTHGIRIPFEAIKGAVGKVADAFSVAKDAIGTAWKKIEDLTKAPINWVINTVWNHGIVSIWDKIAGWIPGVPDLKQLPLLAAGGPMPMQPGIFNQPTAIVGEGNPRYPEFVIPTDPKFRSRALGLYQAAGMQLMDSGGIFGSVWGGIKDAAGWVKDRAVDVGHFLADPIGSMGRLFDPILDKVKAITSTSWGAMVAGIPRTTIKGLKDMVKNSVGTLGFDGGGSGGSGVARWTSVVQEALSLLSQPSGYTGITLRRMDQESGGNPTIVNKWDSNWENGYPSVGLMQVIGPTFDTYAGMFRNTGPFSYGVSTNPLANVYASMRYALAAYGSLPAAYNRAGGYDSGGYLQPGLNLAFNGTGRPEPVFTSQQANALTRLAVQPAGGGEFTGELYLDGGEFLGAVRGEVRQEMSGLTSVLNARRGR